MNYPREIRRSMMASAWEATFRDLETAENVIEEEHRPLNKLLISGTSSSSPMQPTNYNQNPSLHESIPASEVAAMCGFEFPVKDVLEAAHGPLNKRSRLWNYGSSSSPMQPANYNPLDEPSPFGHLSFRQSPSLVKSVQMHPYESGYSEAYGAGSDLTAARAGSGLTTTSVEATMKPGRIMKPKASNFPATLLKIGQWEYKSRCVNGLVAKFYFAKRKLVWEVMEKGLRSKIEIEWSNIIALKTNCPLDGPGTLTLVLAKQPLFFREPKPTARKQTMWEKTTDFTFGQASMNKQHILQCDQGIMNKHIEKLVQFDHRLFLLCRQPEIPMDHPYFEDPKRDDSKGTQNVSTCPSIFGTHENIPSPVESQASCVHMYLPHEAPSPSSVANEGSGSAETVNTRNTLDCVQREVLGLEQYSMPVSDFIERYYGPRNITNSRQVEEVDGIHQSMSMTALLSDSIDITDSS